MSDPRDIDPETQFRLRKRRDGHARRKRGEVETRVKASSIETRGRALCRVLDIGDGDGGVGEGGGEAEIHARGSPEGGTYTNVVGDDGAKAEDTRYGDASVRDGGGEEGFVVGERVR